MGAFMDYSEAKLVVAQNFPGSGKFSERAFVGRLHEECLCDQAEFDRLLEAVGVLAECPAEDPGLNWCLFRIFSFTLASFAHHADAGDGFEISGLGDSGISGFQAGLQDVFEAYFRRRADFHPGA